MSDKNPTAAELREAVCQLLNTLNLGEPVSDEMKRELRRLAAQQTEEERLHEFVWHTLQDNNSDARCGELLRDFVKKQYEAHHARKLAEEAQG